MPLTHVINSLGGKLSIVQVVIPPVQLQVLGHLLISISRLDDAALPTFFCLTSTFSTLTFKTRLLDAVVG